ncbi:MAG: hypothetical protein PHY43_07455 [Verrucomicrobiales bacterium]|nr:hypothetical protein [Verrucomicrobiales bacterium]
MMTILKSFVGLPLTPALSLGERENHLPSLAMLCDWIYPARIEKKSESRMLFPLPKGEGKGEGESVVGSSHTQSNPQP